MFIKITSKLTRKDKGIIEKHLEDAGFVDCVVSLENQELKVPEIYKDELSLIATIAAEAGNYRIDAPIDDLILDD